jgi:hypothetical protein
MLKEEKIFIRNIDVDILADIVNDNCRTLMNKANANSSDITDLMEVVTKLSKKTRHKASKLSFFLITIAGICYVVKNEADKRELSRKLIEAKNEKTVYRYDASEDEGDAKDPTII